MKSSDDGQCQIKGSAHSICADWIHENPAASNLLSPTKVWHIHGLILTDVAAR